jgi:lysyl-tRNA synthetase class I
MLAYAQLYPRMVAAYLYMHTSETMPGPVTDRDGVIQVNADNELIERWSEGRDDVNIDVDQVVIFINETVELLRQLEDLELDPNEDAASQYMRLFYEAAKRTFNYDKSQIRTYFRWLYLVVFQKPDGPRWGEFVEIYGVDEFINKVEDRFSNLM